MDLKWRIYKLKGEIIADCFRISEGYCSKWFNALIIWFFESAEKWDKIGMTISAISPLPLLRHDHCILKEYGTMPSSTAHIIEPRLNEGHHPNVSVRCFFKSLIHISNALHHVRYSSVIPRYAHTNNQEYHAQDALTLPDKNSRPRSYNHQGIGLHVYDKTHV